MYYNIGLQWKTNMQEEKSSSSAKSYLQCSLYSFPWKTNNDNGCNYKTNIDHGCNCINSHCFTIIQFVNRIILHTSSIQSFVLEQSSNRSYCIILVLINKIGHQTKLNNEFFGTKTLPSWSNRQKNNTNTGNVRKDLVS